MNTSIKTWIYATRPHTLGASIAPMLIVLGALINSNNINWGLYILCFIVAVSAQIASNLANDYYGYISGEDTVKRVGFKRLLSSGELQPKEIKIALYITLLVCAVTGLTISIFSGWELLLIGGLILISAITYSAGLFSLARTALGDFAVVLFFGIIPILVSYYAITNIKPPFYLVLLALGIGMWEANILVCNNYRDHSEDTASGKRTLIVRMGKEAGPVLYFINSLVALLALIIGVLIEGSYLGAIIIGIVALSLFLNGVLAIKRLNGNSLNKLLKYTNFTTIVIGVITMAILVI